MSIIRNRGREVLLVAPLRLGTEDFGPLFTEPSHHKRLRGPNVDREAWVGGASKTQGKKFSGHVLHNLLNDDQTNTNKHLLRRSGNRAAPRSARR
jgi:hypothetical protein